MLKKFPFLQPEMLYDTKECQWKMHSSAVLIPPGRLLLGLQNEFKAIIILETCGFPQQWDFNLSTFILLIGVTSYLLLPPTVWVQGSSERRG